MNSYDAKIKDYIKSGLTMDSVIQYFEDNYYQKISEASSFDIMSKTSEFYSDAKHISLYTDHSIVHVKNVACLAVDLCEKLNNLGYYHKSESSLKFMRCYLILLAYLHDAGMCVVTEPGRVTHAEYMAQEVYKEHFDYVIDELMSGSVVPITYKLTQIKYGAQVTQEESVILREILAMACCHSKSTVPHVVLNNRKRLKKTLIETLSSPLDLIYFKKKLKAEQTKHKSKRTLNLIESYRKKIHDFKKTVPVSPDITRFYTDFNQEAYSWLDCQGPMINDIVEDILDSLRVFRAADALRQRGTLLKTSANYQMIVDYKTADVVYALTLKNGRNYLLAMDNPINAGEANLSWSDFSPDGSLCFAFYHGLFGSPVAQTKAEKQAAMVINDIQSDVLGSLSKPGKKMKILLEQPQDNPDFVYGVKNKILQEGNKIYGPIYIIPCLKNCSSIERSRYLSGSMTEKWSDAKKQRILKNIGKMGYRVDTIPIEYAFKYIRLANIQENETVLEASTDSEFAYIALDSGLSGEAIGGYKGFALPRWSIFGHISLLRNAERNATIWTTKPLRVLMIPKITFIKYWRHTYSITELQALLYNNQ